MREYLITFLLCCLAAHLATGSIFSAQGNPQLEDSVRHMTLIFAKSVKGISHSRLLQAAKPPTLTVTCPDFCQFLDCNGCACSDQSCAFCFWNNGQEICLECDDKSCTGCSDDCRCTTCTNGLSRKCLTFEDEGCNETEAVLLLEKQRNGSLLASTEAVMQKKVIMEAGNEMEVMMKEKQQIDALYEKQFLVSPTLSQDQAQFCAEACEGNCSKCSCQDKKCEICSNITGVEVCLACDITKGECSGCTNCLCTECSEGKCRFYREPGCQITSPSIKLVDEGELSPTNVDLDFQKNSNQICAATCTLISCSSCKCNASGCDICLTQLGINQCVNCSKQLICTSCVGCQCLDCDQAGNCVSRSEC